MHWSRAAAVGSSVWAREPPATSILAGGRGWGASEKAKQAAAADRRVPPASASRRNLRCMPGLLWPRQRAEDLRALSVREEGAAAPRRAPEGASRTRDDVAAIAGNCKFRLERRGAFGVYTLSPYLFPWLAA